MRVVVKILKLLYDVMYIDYNSVVGYFHANLHFKSTWLDDEELSID